MCRIMLQLCSVPIKDILKFVHQFAGKPGMEAMVVPSVFQIFEIALKDILKCAMPSTLLTQHFQH